MNEWDKEFQWRIIGVKTPFTWKGKDWRPLNYELFKGEVFERRKINCRTQLKKSSKGERNSKATRTIREVIRLTVGIRWVESIEKTIRERVGRWVKRNQGNGKVEEDDWRLKERQRVEKERKRSHSKETKTTRSNWTWKVTGKVGENKTKGNLKRNLIKTKTQSSC